MLRNADGGGGGVSDFPEKSVTKQGSNFVKKSTCPTDKWICKTTCP